MNFDFSCELQHDQMIMVLFSDPSSMGDFMLQRSVGWRCAVTESITNGHNFKLPLLNIVSTGSFCRNQRISVPSKLDKIQGVPKKYPFVEKRP